MLIQPKKSESRSWTLVIANIYDFDQHWLEPPHCQFTALVDYVRGDSGERWIEFHAPGGVLPRKPVPDTTPDTVDFDFTIPGDTTSCTIRAIVWDAEHDGTPIHEADPRQFVDFLCGGMGMAARGGPEGWKTEVAAAARQESGNNTIAPGIYRGKFKQFDKLFIAHARVLVQGEPTTFTPVPKAKEKASAIRAKPLKLIYDLPASICWHKIGNKYQPFWTFCAVAPLTAGVGFRTIMRPILLRSDGFVEQITTHPY